MKTLLAVVVAGLAIALQAAPKYEGSIKAEEVRERDGIGHVLEKIRAGKEVTVAYLGGSITEMSGWRNLTTEWLRKTYPNAKFNEVAAAIGGTGSDLGVFRVGQDALRHNPDLLFVEFATNDSGAAPEAIWRQMEGIVRQTWAKDPNTDIVFTYTITFRMVEDYAAGRCFASAAAMEMLADHYGIPSIGFGPRVAKEWSEGRLVMHMKDAEKETAVPTETPERDKVISEKLAKEGKILFAKDGVHPAMTGHMFYLASVTNAFAKMDALKPVDHAAKLAKPFVEDHMGAAKMVDLTPDMMIGSWTKLAPDSIKMKSFSKRAGQLYEGVTPGDKIKFRFRGTSCKVYDLLGPDGGQLWITVDGQRRSAPVPRFDSYCTYHRLAALNVFNGPMGEHEVEIEIDSKQPSRQSVAFRLKNPEKELAAPKFQGTKFWPAKIMVVGDVLPPKQDVTKFDKNMATAQGVAPADDLDWIDGTKLPIEGRVFDDVEHYYDRLPANVTTNVNEGVRGMKHHTAGLQFRFNTDAKKLVFRFKPYFGSMQMDHMPRTGVSAIDVYRREPGSDRWKYVKTARDFSNEEFNLTIPWKPGEDCLVNFPLYNGIRKFELGVTKGAKVGAVRPRPAGHEKPIVFLGTSIDHGGCASRPGMAFVNLIGRHLDYPVVNLGFSGSGRMELEMSEHTARIDAKCYVLDCLWNMGLDMTKQRYEPFIRNLRAKRPGVPILMVGRYSVYEHQFDAQNEFTKKLFDKLIAEGWKDLYWLPAERIYTDDEATVDGVHPNDWGMVQAANAFEAALKPILK